MIKDLKDVFSVLVPIRSCKYLWRALGNIWRMLVVFTKWANKEGQRIDFEETLHKKKMTGACSAGDFYELAKKHDTWQGGEDELSETLAQNKPGFLKSMFLLPVNLLMALICFIPTLGVAMTVHEFTGCFNFTPATEQPATEQPATESGAEVANQ